MTPRLALAGLVLAAPLLGAAQCMTPDAHLQPIPAPLMPAIVNVPVLVRIPIAMTEPCPEPPRRPVTTDVQLLEAADAFRVAMKCDEMKLKSIRDAQPKEPAP